ncbi:cell division protein FtsK [Natranaerobius trueperi]|uniref:Cell division protein FtsK n=2 Tax=Natranaerobius trueperi TaxID=759412 RepID=A0A226BZ57_9FIRM|nr:cell division protein FtsK [Natranaerobius trueperi]
MSRGEIMRLGFDLAIKGSGGGFLGAIFSVISLLILGELGTLILLISSALVAFMLLTDTTFTEGLTFIKKFLMKCWNLLLVTNEKIYSLYCRLINLKDKLESDSDNIEQDDNGHAEKEQNNVLSFDEYKKENKKDEQVDYPIVDFEDNLKSQHKNEDEKKAIDSFMTTESQTPQSNSITTFENESEKKDNENDYSYTFYSNDKSHEDYKIPSLDLLQKSSQQGTDRTSRQELTDKARLLESTLSSFGVQAKVVKVQRGPTITRYELQPERGVKVSKIVNLSDDLALSLAASEIRIEAPIPGKAAIGIEVPNNVISPVYLREVLESQNFTGSKSPLSIAIGKDIAGEPVVADLAKMPHLLIAGATGSGKSVSINSLIASFLFKAKPDEVKLLLIDPKVVELKSFDGLPHLLAPVVTNPKNAASTLKNIVTEMENRYQLFAETGVRDISRYNATEKPDDTYPDKLPYIVVIIDELADLMMVAPTEVEDSIFRLAQMSRAAGIHLVLATQRPSVDVITGVIKSNITSRIAFSVTSQSDSRTILDMGGAEKLLGQGDMLFTPMGTNKPVRLQGAFISDQEIDELASEVKSQAQPEYQEELIQDNIEQNDTKDYDELLPKAVELVLDTEQASISLVQRRLRVGYTRAARLVDELEAFGVIGGHEGSKPRRIIMSEQEINELLDNLK